MQFTKMHASGNDYLYYYGELEQPKEMYIKLSDRHFGIGSDGIITHAVIFVEDAENAPLTSVAAGICPLEEEGSVLLDGGKLQILVHTDRTVIMTGTADTVCECEV